jgi:hypothetical protein
MTVATHTSDAHRVLEYVERCRDMFPASTDARFTVAPPRHVYLSTLFRVTRGNERYLVAIKHHDPGGRRAEREFQVLSVLGGSLSPRAVLFDNSRSTFPDPILISTFERPVFVAAWTDQNLTRLARLMATIHTSEALLNLSIDRDAPGAFSLEREFREEVADVETFRDTELKRRIQTMADVLLREIPRWQPAFADDVVTYIHSDLPHHHLFAVEPQWQTVHWEWSRRSHPTRELARALWDMELPADREAFLLDRYQALVPYRIAKEPLEIQRLLQYFYNCVHVAFWLDRTEESLGSENWRKAERLAGVVALWIRMRLEHAA